MSSNVRQHETAEERAERTFLAVVEQEAEGRGSKADREVLTADLDRWLRALVRIKGDLEAELGSRHSESIRERRPAGAYFEWRNNAVATIKKLDSRIRDAKALRRQQEAAGERLSPDSRNRIGAWAATIAAGLCTDETMSDGEVVERAVNMAEMIERLLTGGTAS